MPVDYSFKLIVYWHGRPSNMKGHCTVFWVFFHIALQKSSINQNRELVKLLSLSCEVVTGLFYLFAILEVLEGLTAFRWNICNWKILVAPVMMYCNFVLRYPMVHLGTLCTRQCNSLSSFADNDPVNLDQSWDIVLFHHSPLYTHTQRFCACMHQAFTLYKFNGKLPFDGFCTWKV